MQLHLSDERQAQLSEYAQRHGQDPAVALDEVLADVFAWEKLDHEEALRAIRRGLEDVKAGRTRPVSQVFDELRAKHGLPR